jgi:hypothetical protein
MPCATRRCVVQDLHLLKKHLDSITQELAEAKKIAIRLGAIDREKAERAWADLMIASAEISRRWVGPSAREEIELQREKTW